MAKPRGKSSVQTAKEGSLVKGSGQKATYRQSYADAVQSKDSNVEGLQPICGLCRKGSHRQSSEFSGLKVKASSFDQSWLEDCFVGECYEVEQMVQILVDDKMFSIRVVEELSGGGIFNGIFNKMQHHNSIRHRDMPESMASISGDLSPGRKKEGDDGNTKSVLPMMNGGEQVQINDEARRIAASDRLPVSVESDGAALGKGLEEHVELANLINVNSSLSGGATIRGELKPGPCYCETGLFSDSRTKVSETEDFSLGHGELGGCSVGLEEGGIKEVGSAEGAGGPNIFSRVGWVGLGFSNSLMQNSEALEDRSPNSRNKRMLRRTHRPSAAVQKGEITNSGNHISDGGIQNMNRLFLRKLECDEASFVWEMGKTLGAEPRGHEKEILRRIADLEARDREERAKL
ncbi:hypothetical protein Ancab_003463 [Ancistrocladus abbreviatus]